MQIPIHLERCLHDATSHVSNWCIDATAPLRPTGGLYVVRLAWSVQPPAYRMRPGIMVGP